MVQLSRRMLAAGAVAVAVLGVGGIAQAEDIRWTLHRQDAVAEFSVAEPECPAVGHTDIGVAFHEDVFRDHGGPATRNVLFGFGIEEIDCEAQFAWRAEGTEAFLRPFDIKGLLKSTEIHTTVQACLSFPSAGDCFPVQIDLQFTGIGPVDTTRDRVHVTDPDCHINNLDVRRVRDAQVQGTISFTTPDGEDHSYSLTSSDLSGAGANLSTEFQRNMLRGDGPNCTEQ